MFCLLPYAGGKMNEMMADGAESALGENSSAEAVQIPPHIRSKSEKVRNSLAYSSLVPGRYAHHGMKSSPYP